MDDDFTGPSITEFFPAPDPTQIAFAIFIVIAVLLVAASAIIAVVATRRARRPIDEDLASSRPTIGD